MGKFRGHYRGWSVDVLRDDDSDFLNSCRDVWVVSPFRAGLQFNSSGLGLVGGIYKVYGLVVGDGSFGICC